VGGGAQVVIGVRKIVKNGCSLRTIFELSAWHLKTLSFRRLEKWTPSPHPYGLPPATRAVFGFALAIARTRALDLLAYASASRLDPTPTVTVGQLQPLRVFRNTLCLPRQKVYFSIGVYLVFEKNQKRKVTKRRLIKLN